MKKAVTTAVPVQEEHFVRAFMRVGTDPIARTRWLLSFAERSVERREEIEQARWEIAAFTAIAGPVPKGLPVWALGRQPLLSDSDPTAAVKAIHGRLRRVLAELRAHRWCPLDVHIVEVVWSDEGQLEPRAGGDDSQRFEAAVLFLLSVVGPRLRACAAQSCPRLFVKAGKQAYCGKGCSQRTRTARFLAKSPERAGEARRESYVRKVRKTHPKVRVARRKRSSGS